MRRWIRLSAGVLSLAAAWTLHLTAQETPADPQPAAAEAAEKEESIASAQEGLAMRYHRFESTMLQVAEYLRKTDPERADLLVRPIGKSKETRLNDQFQALVNLLKQDQLGDALEEQQHVVVLMQGLLELLQSEDRKDEIEKEKQRIHALLKELGKLIDIQTDVRSDTERKENPKNLENRQAKLADDAQKLADKIASQDAAKAAAKAAQGKAGKPSDGQKQKDGEQNKEPKEGDDAEPSPDGDQESKDKDGESKSGDGQKSKDGQKGKGSKSKDGEKNKDDKNKDEKNKDGEKSKSGDEPKEGEKPEENEASPSEGQSSESQDSQSGKPKKSKPQKSQSGQPQKGQPSQSPDGDEEESQDSQSQDQQEAAPSQQVQTPGREEIQRAKEDMERAIEELKKKNHGKASDEQDKALAELIKAKEKLEEILRQLREEERDLLLAALEARFRDMLARELGVYNGTVGLFAVPESQRSYRHRSRAVELARAQEQIALLAAKALTLLKEEGSSIAFPEAVEQMRDDMLTVVGRLERFDVAELTQGIERDIIESLEELIEALQKEMEKSKDKKQNPQQQENQQQEPPLVDQLAELKTLRALQYRVNRRTKILGREVDGEQAADPDVIKQLREQARRQEKIQNATYDLSTGRNK
jgi:hypothetical protein